MLERAGIRPPGVGIYIAEPGTERPLVEVAADQSFNPASTMKLVTTIAALELLGPEFRWYTTVLMTGRIVKGVLEGNLIVRGGNDPTLTWARLDDLVKRLRKRGITTIQGNIVIDRTLYMAPESEALAYVAETNNPWNSPPDSLVLNSKMVTLRFIPDTRSRTVTVSVDPPLEAVQVRGTVAFVDAPCPGNGPQFTVDASGDVDYARIRVDGTLASGCGHRSVPISVMSHRDYFQRAFAQLWANSGGGWIGRFEDIADPLKRTILLERIASAPLAEVTKDINKTSNNLMARQLFLEIAISADATSPKVRTPLATRAFERVRRMLREHGIDVPDLVMENGSGLSNIERNSPRGLAQILGFALKRPYASDLVASLPIVGFDGTMRDRLRTSPAAGTAFLKTGTLPEVRALAGYVWDAVGKIHLVVIVVNHRNASSSLAAIDTIIDWVHRRPNSIPETLVTAPSAVPKAAAK